MNERKENIARPLSLHFFVVVVDVVVVISGVDYNYFPFFIIISAASKQKEGGRGWLKKQKNVK